METRPFCFTSTEVRWLIRDGGGGGGGGERVKARQRISPEKDRRNRGPNRIFTDWFLDLF